MFRRLSLQAFCSEDIGLGAGGSIRQVIERAPERPQDWDLAARARCFVHLANSEVWRTLTGEAPPTVPPSAADYTRAGLPWFDWYGEQPPDTPPRPTVLGRIRSVFSLSREGRGGAAGERELPPAPARAPQAPEPGRLAGGHLVAVATTTAPPRAPAVPGCR
jgi:hypothetical protein